MIAIAVMGANSEIAKDFIRSNASSSTYELLLFVRDLGAMSEWLDSAGIGGCYQVFPYSEYVKQAHDVVINFVGVGDPVKAAAMGANILDVTLEFDGLILAELRKYPLRRYFFISSGAAYGDSFSRPVSRETGAVFPINNIGPQNYYSIAKLHSEVRHRSLFDRPIVDVRIFNYFSRYQNLASRYFIVDMVNAIKSDKVLQVSADLMTRDYLHPKDFFQLISCLLAADPQNTVVDCYTSAPVEKIALLDSMRENFGLKYEMVPDLSSAVNATGVKAHYYSTNKKAAQFGYLPHYSSLEGLCIEVRALLEDPAIGQ